MTNEEKQKAMLSHLLSLFAGFISPLIFFLIAKEEESFLKEHARVGLNFQISMSIYLFACGLLSILIIPIFIAIGLWIYLIVQIILGTVAANKGEEFTYGLTIEFIK